VVAKGDFQASDLVMAVHEQVFAARHVPCHKQRLFWQGHVLDSHCRLEELALPAEGAEFQLQMKTGPTDEELERVSELKQVLVEGYRCLSGALHAGLRWMGIRHSLEIKLVCLATMQLLAGYFKSIPTYYNGSPKDDSWDGIEKMVQDPYFLATLLDVPSIIDQGKLSQKRMHACLAHLQDIPGHTDSEKIASLQRTESFLGAPLLGYLLSISKYYDMVSSMRQSQGVACLRDALDAHDNSCSSVRLSARRALVTAYQSFPRGQLHSKECLYKLASHQLALDRIVPAQETND